MCPVLLPAKSDGRDPVINQSSILSCAQVAVAVYPAREGIIINSAASTLEPRPEAGSYTTRQFELNRPVRLLLHDGRSSSDLTSSNQVANLELDQVTAA